MTNFFVTKSTFSCSVLGQTCMVLTLEFETLFLEALTTSSIYLITSKVRFVKGLANSTLTRDILTYVEEVIQRS